MEKIPQEQTVGNSSSGNLIELRSQGSAWSASLGGSACGQHPTPNLRDIIQSIKTSL